MYNNRFDFRFEEGEEINQWISGRYIEGDRFLYIFGLGFDQRTCSGVNHIIKNTIPFDFWEICFDEGINSPSHTHSSLRSDNQKLLSEILAEKQVVKKELKMWETEERDGRLVAEINASRMIKEAEKEIKNYSDIIVDISALPQSIYFPIINMLLCQGKVNQRIYVITNENYQIDMSTAPVASEETAHEMQGFSSSSEDLDELTIWFPILGEGNPDLLDKYHNYLTANNHNVDEICPVVPFPAVDIKRADNIILEYRELLFDKWQVDKKNIIYASETDPFQVCRQLRLAAIRYSEVLKPVGECKFVFSTISSKLMSIGALLAAESLKPSNKVSFLHIANKGYKIENHSTGPRVADKLTCMQLTGSCYDGIGGQ